MLNKIEISDNTNFLVKKDRDLVHKAKYSLSVNSMKYLSSLICMIREDDTEFKTYSTNAKEMSELIGSPINIIKLRAIASELANLKIPFIDNKGREAGYFNMFDSIRYDYDTFSINAMFGITAKPYLVEFKNGYLKYGIGNILSLKSTVVIRLYEMCKDKLTRYKKEPKSETFTIEMKDFRDVLKIKSSYKYAHIKSRYLDKAQKDFIKHTDIAITYKEIKRGRKVEALKITVTRIKEEYQNQPSNFKPYLQFRDYIRDNLDIYNNEYVDKSDDGFLFPLVGGYNIHISDNLNHFLIADEDDRIINNENDVDYAWKLAYENKDEILKRI